MKQQPPGTEIFSKLYAGMKFIVNIRKFIEIICDIQTLWRSLICCIPNSGYPYYWVGGIDYES